ncbi:MAG TPA: urea carboxylase [Polyangiaceae bacterium]|jgi:urea carboxylase|nr:urea carboxylase [Polyangiaceae bacterium]
MFDKVLIANRGEIACRVIRTLKKLGVGSVAIYSEADRNSLHVFEADEGICVGPAAASASYLNRDVILNAAERTAAKGIFPGYGFLSENAEFAEAAEARGIAFIGPTPEQMRRFGVKHTARELAQALSVPLLAGTPLLASVDEAVAAAEKIGYPVMLKSTAGGGGIGMQVCRDAEKIREIYESVRSLAQKNFGEGGVFLERFVERARHIEVQLFGDGRGKVIALGERDCSAQRRHQKVIEETPAPRLRADVRKALHEAAVRIGKSVNYRSAGTVEFVYDDDREEFYFLEVNTRLQVEHGVTELVTGVDLVEWMVRLAAGESVPLEPVPEARGHAVEVRIYAEDPTRGFRPSPGVLSEVVFPDGVRVDSFVERGSEISGFYDPMIAKLMALGETRAEAIEKLRKSLGKTRISGTETNLDYVAHVLSTEVFREGLTTTAFLGTVAYASPTIEVIAPGTLSTVHDYPGRLGYWDVGIPPSGPMDDLNFRLANRAVGNEAGAPALELTVTGPTLRFAVDAVVALAGARMEAELEGAAVEYFTPIAVRAGQTLKMGAIVGPGCRAYLAVRHGFDVPEYLGSRSTFTLGGFGGHAGRALRKGDVLRLLRSGNVDGEPEPLDPRLRPNLVERWEIGVLYGPHGAPDFFTPADIERFFGTDFEVHYNSARTGVRLIGPQPEWARADGGEAGLHPSNIHDNAYAFGTVDFTGDMPIILGPDGPSLGGFVCPATIARAQLWKVGQLRPGNKLRFVPIARAAAELASVEQDRAIAERKAQSLAQLTPVSVTEAVVRRIPERASAPKVVYRPAGDDFLLVEYGEAVLDLELRFRVHALMDWLRLEKLPGIIDLTPGIRSLQLHFDSQKIGFSRLLDVLERAESELPSVDDIDVPTRIVHMPLSWDDPQTRLAIEKYTQIVRKDAPWTPSNIEFIRRINGLDAIEAVKKIVFDASYLVLGLGDVYLGAPVATPLDPRQRLVTTKYNPARTWTPENAVGIGGAYLCIYGMEGPGGYQFVGRTVQVYNRFKTTKQFERGTPWLLRFFDQIRFYPVSAPELLEMREAFPHGRLELKIEEQRFRLADYRRFLAQEAESIAAFRQLQRSAFAAERQRWLESGQLNFSAEQPSSEIESGARAEWAGAQIVESGVPGSIWKVLVSAGQRVEKGQTLAIVESMKMELAVESPVDGVVLEVVAVEGRAIAPGQPVVVVKPAT